MIYPACESWVCAGVIVFCPPKGVQWTNRQLCSHRPGGHPEARARDSAEMEGGAEGTSRSVRWAEMFTTEKGINLFLLLSFHVFAHNTTKPTSHQQGCSLHNAQCILVLKLMKEREYIVIRTHSCQTKVSAGVQETHGQNTQYSSTLSCQTWL